jgi:hypothetical protein
VPAEAISRLWVPVPGNRPRYRLVAVIGQADGRLRVIGAPVTIEWPGAITAAGDTMRPLLFPWPRRMT